MEDKKRKKEDKRKREASQKVAEQKNKELNKPISAQSLTTTSSASPSPGPGPSSYPSPATVAAGGPQGGNNAKRSAVANGQPPAGGQATQRYMPREVPPRFRCQQDHKVLLKRGQPPLSCMLLGGGNSEGTTPPLLLGDNPNTTVAAASDSAPGSSGSAAPTLSHTSSSLSSSVAASSTISSSNYANSTWGASSGSQPLSQGWEKVIVDRSDLEEWPSIGAGAATGDGAKTKETGGAPWSDRHLQQRVGKGGRSGSPSLPSSSSPNECAQLGSSAWGGLSSQAIIGGGVAVAGPTPSKSKVSPLSGNLGANFNPNANPSAWPALVHDGAAAADGDPSPLPNSSSLPANPSLSQTAPSGNTVSHQHQVHQMQVRDREALCGDWGSTRLEQNTGPKKAGLGPEDETDCGVAGGGDLSTSSSSSSASSSCRVLPLSSNPKTGASKTDTWEGGAGGALAPGDGGNVSGYSSKNGKGVVGGAGSKAWETGSGGSCNASGVSQGEWGEGEEVELSVEEWGSSVGETGTGGSGNLVTGGSCGGSTSSSSSSGGSISNPAPSSPGTAATSNFDNQKGVGDGGTGELNEWGGQGRPGGGGASSSCGSGHSRAGGSLHGQHQGNSHHRFHQPPKAEVALQNLLSRADLDPRVLSNSGWGQIQIRQNVAWDLEGDAIVGSTGVSSTGVTATYPSTTDLSAASLSRPQKASLEPNAAGLSNGEGWDSRNSISAFPSSASSTRNPGTAQVVASGGSVESSGNPANTQGKLSGGWGGVGPSENLGKGWGNEGQNWRECRGEAEPGGWGDFGQQGTTAGGGCSGWGRGQDEKGTGGWNEKGKEAVGWGLRGGGDWDKREAKAGSKGQGEGKGSGCVDWGSWDEGGPRRGWDGGVGGGGSGGDMSGNHQQEWGGNAHLPQLTNSQASVQQQQSQIQLQDTGATRGSWDRPGGQPSQNQNQSSGWTSGPIPQGLSGPSEGPEPSGWEEPSPQSLSRKMEIDDGTSAWGDPSHYNYKNVNHWGKNSGPSGQSQPPNSLVSAQQQLGPSNPQQQQATGRLAHQPAVTANRDSNAGPGRNSVMGWGSGGTPSSPSVDNGTAVWGKPDATTGWGDLEDAGKPAGWGNPSASTGSKSMQDGWGEGDGSVSASRHSSWEEEEEPSGVWSSTGSQGSNSSYNSGGWGQSHTGKKGNSKGALKGGCADSWMNPMTRQFSNMGLLGEDPGSRSLDLAPGPPQDKKLDGEKRGMNDYNGEMRKGGRGGSGGGGTVFRSSSSKEVGPSEPGPYYDKMVGHNVFGSSSGMVQSRGVLQPGVSPINPSPSIRTQVPQQLLSPQVPGSVLKQMPRPNSNVGGVGGIGGGVFPAYLSPQHIAMLSSIYPTHLQLQLACQLLLQQQSQQQQQPQPFLQNQRKFQQNIRQQPDPQQLTRIMAVLRQQQVGVPSSSSKLSPSHLGGGHSKQPMADSLPYPGLGGSLSDQLNPKTLAGYPGFGSGVNISGFEMGSMVGGPAGAKEGGQQSRFKWMMEGHSPAPSPPQSGLHKNGPISGPEKLRDSSPYSQYELIGNDGLVVPPQDPSDNWHRTPGKMGSKSSSSSWPPEFQPGVPWKGIQNADPESDPYVTPGSVLGSSAASNLNDMEHQLLRDNTEPNSSLNTLLPSHGAWPYSASDSPLNNTHNPAKYTEYKPSWPPDPIGHKLWKANRNNSQLPRPPPGLSHQKQPSPSPWSGGGPRLARAWGGSGGNQETRYGPGSTWGDSGASRTSCWLLLSNLTPQIDGSTLRTICMQHGPLLTFHLGLTQGSALIRYSSRQEAAKAQSALHMCVLGNTTILAEFVSDEEVSQYFAHSQVARSTSGTSVTTPAIGGGQGPSGSSTVGTNSGGSTPGNERERERPGAGGGGLTGGSNSGRGGVGGMGPPCGWQGLDGTGSSPDPSQAQGPNLSVFTQWSSNGAAGGVGAGGVGNMEPGRQALWGGMTPSYPTSSLWGTSPMEDRHQMGSPAALLPGDLLGGGTDSI